MKLRLLLLALPLTIVAACKTSDNSGNPAPQPNTASDAPPTEVKPTPQQAPRAELPASQAARVGATAPEFTLPDLDGKKVTLSQFEGKTVVLEWFNPNCPFVKAAHTAGSLIETASKLQQRGVVYLAINSGAPGKQGHGKEANLAGKERFKLTHPILLDESGEVGRAYGATNTPHIFVINDQGTLVYAGAVDNSPDGEGQSPEGGSLVNYLEQAVDEVLAGKPVSVPQTKAYGCSVKYAQ